MTTGIHLVGHPARQAGSWARTRTVCMKICLNLGVLHCLTQRVHSNYFRENVHSEPLQSTQARLNKAAGAADAAREVNRDVIA